MAPLAGVMRFDGWDALPAAHRPVLDGAAQANFFRSLPWFRALCATSLDPGDALCLYAAGDPPALILPMRRPGGRAALAPRTLTSLANFYSCDFAPLARDGVPTADDTAAIAAALRAERPAPDLVDLTSMPYPSAAFDAVAQGFVRSGWWVQRYFHFGNWFEPSDGVSSADYLAARPPALRNTLRRKSAALDRRPDVRIELVTGDRPMETRELDQAIDAYEAVYRASWKGHEPYPRFSAAFIRACAEARCLRLGLVHVGDTPAAAQIWVVWNGRATLCKLAHDERFKPLSVGTVLTWRMMAHVLDADRVREVDFGRGDDPYKALWMSQRREHWGLLAFNPATPWGCLAAARHVGGRMVRRTLQRLRP
ncbi:MAG: GNAT family N-acetyltransferase [Alphaproteobacteria bacterium]|nr:GNAT family N-acetyltransferase [Alphaproteobacteria bacterium]